MIIQIKAIMQNCAELWIYMYIGLILYWKISGWVFSLLEVNKNYFLFSAAGAPVDWDEIPIR